MNNFDRQSFAQQYNHNLSIWLKSIVGSLVLHFKTLLLLLGETFRRAKVTNFPFSAENFARRIVSPDRVVSKTSLVKVIVTMDQCHDRHKSKRGILIILCIRNSKKTQKQTKIDFNALGIKNGKFLILIIKSFAASHFC